MWHSRYGNSYDYNLFAARSSDYGETWSTAVPVPSTKVGDNWSPVLVAVGTKVVVLWHSTRESSQNYNIFSSTSTDFGFTWSDAVHIGSDDHTFGTEQDMNVQAVVVGDTIIAAWTTRYGELNGLNTHPTFFISTSNDAGATWSSQSQLKPSENATLSRMMKDGNSVLVRPFIFILKIFER